MSKLFPYKVEITRVTSPAPPTLLPKIPVVSEYKPDTEYIVDNNKLNQFGWNKVKWFFHSRKANIIFLLLLGVIIGSIVLIVLSYIDGKCEEKKQMNSIIVGVDIIVAFFAYMLVWPYTQWLHPKNVSKFTGHSQIALQQNPVMLKHQ